MPIPNDPEMTAPVAKMKGRFNLFDSPDGGFHIAYQPDPTETNPDPAIEHIDVPGAIVRAAQMLASGKMTPGKVMNILMSLPKG